MNDREFKRLNPLQVSSLREGFFSRRSNLTTIATSLRIKIIHFCSCFKGIHELASFGCLRASAMTTFLGRSVIDSGVDSF